MYSTKRVFITKLVKTPEGTSAVIYLPFDAEEAFGSYRAKVRGTIDGASYRSSIFKMHNRVFMLINEEMREKIKKYGGEQVHVVMEVDTEERVVKVPKDLATALKKAKLNEIFDKLSYTHRKEYVRWIEDAKKQRTREMRINKTLKILKEKVYQCHHEKA